MKYLAVELRPIAGDGDRTRLRGNRAAGPGDYRGNRRIAPGQGLRGASLVAAQRRIALRHGGAVGPKSCRVGTGARAIGLGPVHAELVQDLAQGGRQTFGRSCQLALMTGRQVCDLIGQTARVEIRGRQVACIDGVLHRLFETHPRKHAIQDRFQSGAVDTSERKPMALRGRRQAAVADGIGHGRAPDAPGRSLVPSGLVRIWGVP